MSKTIIFILFPYYSNKFSLPCPIIFGFFYINECAYVHNLFVLNALLILSYFTTFIILTLITKKADDKISSANFHKVRSPSYNILKIQVWL